MVLCVWKANSLWFSCDIHFIEGTTPAVLRSVCIWRKKKLPDLFKVSFMWALATYSSSACSTCISSFCVINLMSFDPFVGCLLYILGFISLWWWWTTFICWLAIHVAFKKVCSIPYICVSILYWSLSFWLTSLCIIGSSFIHLIRTDSNVFFLMAERIALKQVYYQGWNRSPAQVGCMRQVLGPGTLGRPRGMGWGRRREGGRDGEHM